jgi:hypothetical protein
LQRRAHRADGWRRCPLPVTRPISGAGHLDRAHQQIGREKGPGQSEAEKRARLGVCRDPARVASSEAPVMSPGPRTSAILSRPGGSTSPEHGPWRLGLQEPHGPVAAQIGNDHPRPGLRQDRRGLIIGMGVVREGVAHDARPAGGRPVFQVSDGKTPVSMVLTAAMRRYPPIRPRLGSDPFTCDPRPSLQSLDGASCLPYYHEGRNSRRMRRGEAYCTFSARERADIGSASVPLALTRRPLEGLFCCLGFQLTRKGGELRLWPST